MLSEKFDNMAFLRINVYLVIFCVQAFLICSITLGDFPKKKEDNICSIKHKTFYPEINAESINIVNCWVKICQNLICTLWMIFLKPKFQTKFTSISFLKLLIRENGWRRKLFMNKWQ